MRLRTLFLLWACWALVACAPAVTPAPATPVPDAGSPAPPTEAITTPAAGPITITYWEEDSNEAVVLLDQMAEAFMQAYPDIVIVREHLGYDELRNSFRAASWEGKAPALVRAPGEFAGPFGELGIAKPLDELFSAEFLAQFFSGALDGATVRGRLWGIPDNYGGHLLLLYNRELVSAAPADTDAWIAQLRGLTDAAGGRYGLVYPSAESYWLIPWLSAFGGWPLDAQEHVALDTVEMVRALWFAYDLKFTQRVMPEDVTYQKAFDLFRTGQAAYIIDGAWNLAQYKDLGIDVGVALLPKASATGLTPAPMATGRYWFIAAGLESQALDAAATFVEYMTAAETQRQWLTQMERLPSRKDVAQSALVTGDPQLAGIVGQLRVARGVPPALEMACAWQGIGAVLEATMAGQLSPDDAPPQMQARAETCIEDMGGYLTPTP